MPRLPQIRLVAAGAALASFLLAAWGFGAALALRDAERVVLRVGLAALGVVAAGAILWYLRPAAPPQPAAADDGDDEAIRLVAAARAQLPHGAFDARPVVLVLGAAGSCKTSVVTRADLDPVLLAGDAPALGPGEAPPATDAANVWLADDAVLVEPGGAVFGDAERWSAFVRALRPPWLAVAVGRGEAAPRAAVLCVSCDLLYAPGAPGADAPLDALARLARERLAEAARLWGVALPVYVAFTRADRIAHFEAWAAPFTRDEIRAPLGAALPFDAGVGALGDRGHAGEYVGGYAERLGPRLAAAYDGIVAALAQRRLELLGRESVARRRLGAYEFPRELGKLAPAVRRFLLEVCRPLQLGVSPRLRGFYFVGARPVVVADAPSAAAAPAVGSYAPATPRRVPEWTFLDRLFPDVVLADRGGAVAARGGVRVARLRRGLLGAGIAAAVLVALSVLRSWAGNRALAASTGTAARDVAVLPTVSAPEGTLAFPSVDALRRLDALRAVLDTVQRYEIGGVPARLRWGLWQGGTLADAGRRVWWDGYRRQLHAAAWGALVDSLRALPETPRPDDNYGRTYANLRAYLVTTAAPERSTPEFLTPVLQAHWARGQAIDADAGALARRQFAFYARALPIARAWPAAADAALVGRTRAFLARFTGSERMYQYMLAEASKATPSAHFPGLSPSDAAPHGGEVVSAAGEVPGAYTTRGWAYMQDAFHHADRFFAGERWVLGDATAAQAGDRDRVLSDLRARYRADYVTRWRAYVRGLTVARTSNARDAAQQLVAFGGPQSPLLAALSLAARNTAVDSGVAVAFQPVHAVTPPATPDRLVSEANQAYAGGLLALEGALEQVSNLPPATDTAGALQAALAGQQALTQATQAKVAARQLAQKFSVDTAAAPLTSAVAALLVAPIEAAERVLRPIAATRPPQALRVATARGAGAGGHEGSARAPVTRVDVATLNERGRALCAAITPVLAKFPFSPDASVDASLAEVNALFAPGTGALWAFEQERLEGLVERQGDRYVQKPGAPVALSAPFLAFLTRAALMTNALYGDAPVPRVLFTVRGAGDQPVTFAQGTQVAHFGKDAPPAQFTWPSTTGRDARLDRGYTNLLIFKRTRPVAQASGEWALFHLVARAGKWEGRDGMWRAEWTAGGRGPVAVEFAFPSGAPVLQRGWLGNVACVGQVTR